MGSAQDSIRDERNGGAIGGARYQFTDLFAGAALGLLVGMVVGMAATDVVASLLGALVAMLSALIGVVQLGGGKKVPESSDSGVPRIRAHGQRRLTAFAVFAVVGLLGGVYLRAHRLLSPSTESRGEAWRQAGAPANVAWRLVALEQLGATIQESETGDGIVALIPDGAAEATRSRSSSLFAGKTNDVLHLAPDYLTNRETQNWLQAFRGEGGAWEEYATRVAAVFDDDAERRAALGRFYEVLDALRRAELSKEDRND